MDNCSMCGIRHGVQQRLCAAYDALHWVCGEFEGGETFDIGGILCLIMHICPACVQTRVYLVK